MIIRVNPYYPQPYSVTGHPALASPGEPLDICRYGLNHMYGAIIVVIITITARQN
jgi:hypothetical protein